MQISLSRVWCGLAAYAPRAIDPLLLRDKKEDPQKHAQAFSLSKHVRAYDQDKRPGLHRKSVVRARAWKLKMEIHSNEILLSLSLP